MAEKEPALASFVHATILKHDRLENALSYHLAKKIGGEDLSPMMTREIFEEAMAAEPAIGAAVRADLSAVFERDPACKAHIEALLFYKGFHALESHRIAHWLWTHGRGTMAAYFQSRISEKFDVDIHPAAKLGRGIMIDHATGVVIGETAVVEDDVSIMQDVTLGGTGKEIGDRHPKVRRGVLISLGARCSAISRSANTAGSARAAWFSNPCRRAAPRVGVPAHLTNCAGGDRPSQEMNQFIDEGDG